MFKNKILIFIILMIALLSIGVASADESSINATDTVSLDYDDSSTKVTTSMQDKDNSLDVASVEDDVTVDLDDSSTEAETSANDENTSLDVVSEDNIETFSDDVKTFNSFSNENTINNTKSNNSDNTTFSNDNLISSSDSATQNEILDNEETQPKSFSVLEIEIMVADTTLKLDSNYKMDDIEQSRYKNGIPIEQNININGKGFTIDAGNLGRIFNIASGYTLTLSNVILTNGINNDFGGSIYNNGVLVLNNVTFINNSATSGGGAFYSGGTFSFTSGIVYVIDCNFINNSANSGGAFYNTAAIGSVNGCTFINNSATYGGAIYSYGPREWSLTDCSFVNNSASDSGDAIFAYKTNVNAINNWWGTNNPIWNKLCYGLVTQDSYVVLNLIATDKNVSINFYRNGTNEVIGIPTRDLNLIIGNQENTYKISGTFKTDYVAPEGNYAVTAIVDNQKLAINFVKYVHVDPERGDDANDGFNWDSAVKSISKAMELVPDNGRIYLADGIHNVTSQISINKTITIIGNGTKTVITNNGADDGVFYISTSDVAIYNCTFANNSAGHDGAIYNAGSILTVNGCTFVNNSAPAHGGAISSYNSNSVFVSNCTFINNSAGWDGGAIYGYNTTVSDCIFINNSAGWDGGAIYGYGTTVSDCIFINNSAENGGAIDSYQSFSSVSGCTFINNSAKDRGGAIYNIFSEISVTDSIFDNNTANKGVIYNFNKLTLNNNKYSGISEGKTYIYNEGTLSFVVVTVLDNKTIPVKKGNTIPLYAVITCDGASVYGKTLQFYINGNSYNAESNINGSYIASYDVDFTNLEEVVSASYNGATNVIVNTAVLTYKLDPELNISVENITYGKDLIISGNITKGITGNVTITINDTLKYNTTISNDGKIYHVVPDLDAGVYKITVKYEGDEKYVADEVTKITHVTPTKVNLEVSIANVTYGEASTITVKLTGINNTKLNGTVIITINDNNYTVNIENGTGTSDKIKLPAGKYQFSAIWNTNNNNYTDTKAYGSFNVSKANLNIDIKADSIKVEQNVTITVTGLANATGNITIKVDNKTYEVKIENGIATKEIANLNTGNYTLNVTYNGDNNYNPTVASSNFTVAKLATNIDFEAKNITYGENATLTILNLPKDTTGNLTITVDGETYSVIDVKDTTIISSLNVGNHTISAKYSGDNKYLESNITHNISVAKADSKLNVNIKDINYGELLDITATLTGLNNTQLNGNITITINNKNYTVEIKDGACTYVDISLPAGEYEFTATWEGNTNYSSTTFEGKFTINKINSTLKVDVKDIIVGENANVVVKLYDDTTGNVIVTVGENKYIVPIKNGTANIIIPNLPIGDNNIIVNYTGDNNYLPNGTTSNIIVHEALDYNMTIDAPDNVKVGDIVTISVNLANDATGNVNITIDGETYFTIVKNGIASVNVTGLTAGNHSIIAEYEGNDKYSPKYVISVIKVSKVGNYELAIDVDNITVGEDLIIKVNVPKDATGRIIINIKDNDYVTNINNGVATFTIPNLKNGTYNITATYDGNDKYALNETNTTIKVTNNMVNLTVNDVVMIYHDGTCLIANLLDSNRNPIANEILSFTINGMTYNKTTDINGSASIALNLEVGNYTAKITYLENKPVNATVTIKSSITANDIVKMYQNDTQFYATFIDTYGNPLANKDITFNINGVFYTRTTDSNGTTKLTINLNPGNYTLTAINSANNEQRGFNILVKSLIEANDLTKYYQNESKFESKIYNKDGSLAINKEVKFNINGVLYTRTTDENGIVRIGINLRPGDYVITTIVDGLSIGNNVKVLPTILTNDLNMNFQDGSKFTAETLNGQGNPLPNQNVTFNVNGVFYHRTTGNDGIANLNINLLRGEYIITSIWNDYQVGNKITIS